MNTSLRADGRNYDALRSITVERNVFGYARSSILFSAGNTKVFCAVTLQEGVPHFLRGQKIGWLTAEYAMLPFATHTRTTRAGGSDGCMKRDGRSVEISRLIGRCLRSVTDLTGIGEQTLIIDCQVLQADGGTRVACITASSMALEALQKDLLAHHLIKKPFLREKIVGISVALLDNDQLMLDPTYEEDSRAVADFNFIIGVDSAGIIEIQGTAERGSVAWETFLAMNSLARKGARELLFKG